MAHRRLCRRAKEFGSRLLNKILVAQTAAEVDIAFDADGLRVQVRVPLERR
ncbi:hypothetical protein ACRBEV_16215 [Methylobacterium phyllosphaerae]